LVQRAAPGGNESEIQLPILSDATAACQHAAMMQKRAPPE
jgi:hypothetical protein